VLIGLQQIHDPAVIRYPEADSLHGARHPLLRLGQPRTHPHTEDRIRRLRELAPESGARHHLPEARLPADLRSADHGRPRWRVTGIWR